MEGSGDSLSKPAESRTLSTSDTQIYFDLMTKAIREKMPPPKKEVIPAENIMSRVERVNKRFGLRQHSLDNAAHIHAYRVDENTLADEIRNHLVSEQPRTESPQDQGKFERALLEHAITAEGITIKNEQGDIFIYIKDGTTFDKETALDHELLHALSYDSSSRGNGFVVHDGENKVYDDKNFNEATVEILRLAVLFPSLSVPEIAQKVRSGQEVVGYKDIINVLLYPLESTYKNGGIPVSLEELASAFFNSEELGIDGSRLKIAQKIIEGMPAGVERSMTRLMLAKPLHLTGGSNK